MSTPPEDGISYLIERQLARSAHVIERTKGYLSKDGIPHMH